MPHSVIEAEASIASFTIAHIMERIMGDDPIFTKDSGST